MHSAPPTDPARIVMTYVNRNHFVKVIIDSGEAYDSIREVCIFLLNAVTLPADKALAVYIQSPGSPFIYCGAISWPEPSDGGQLQLTAPDAAPLTAKIGVSIEDLATLSSLDVAAEMRIEHLTMKVGENLFNFMQSFCDVNGSKLVVPMYILDRWFKKFQERAKRDLEYLKGFLCSSIGELYMASENV